MTGVTGSQKITLQELSKVPDGIPDISVMKWSFGPASVENSRLPKIWVVLRRSPSASVGEFLRSCSPVVLRVLSNVLD